MDLFTPHAEMSQLLKRKKKKPFSWHSKVGLYEIPGEQQGKIYHSNDQRGNTLHASIPQARDHMSQTRTK